MSYQESIDYSEPTEHRVPEFTVAKFVKRHNQELTLQTETLKPAYSPLLQVLKDCKARHPALTLNYIAVGVSNTPTQIVVSQRAYRRADSFTVHLLKRLDLAWIGTDKFYGDEPESPTSTRFLANLAKRIDDFCAGAAKVGFHAPAPAKGA